MNEQQGPFPTGLHGEPGLQHWLMTSPFQRGSNSIEILLPDAYSTAQSYPHTYLMPVTQGARGSWGCGILTARQLDLANRYQTIVIYPAFAESAFLADHPADPLIRQESYCIQTLLPFIDATYGRPTAQQRNLVGFSKSGNGILSLAMRNPGYFQRLLAFDAPSHLYRLQWEMGTVFGTDEHLQNYVPQHLLQRPASQAALKQMERLVIMGSDLFGEHVERFHHTLETLGIPHIYDQTTGQRLHHWDGNWLETGMQHLFNSASA